MNVARTRLQLFRRIVAAVVFAGFLLAFVDFRGAFAKLGHALAHVQFVPSAIALATGASVAVGGIAVLLLTLTVGRVYCAALCPLGILQDAIARAGGSMIRRHHGLPYRRADNWLRHFVLAGVLVTVAVGWAGLALALLDPFSAFGRIATDLLRPVVILLNNALTSAGIPGLNRATAPSAGAGALAIPVVTLLLVAVLAAWRGRLYCNTVCPVGTVLGLAAKCSVFRLHIERSTCEKCAACLNVCKAQCIDLRAGTIDASRCVQCFNCIAACDRQAIRFERSWTRRASGVVPVSPIADRARPVDPRRRAFISGLSAATIASAAGLAALVLPGVKRSAVRRRGRFRRAVDGDTPRADQPIGVVAPPGAGGIRRFLDRCTACHLCISTCPTRVLQPAFLEYGAAGLAKPHLDYTNAYCNYDCHRCTDVCPTGALVPLSEADKHAAKIGEARLEIDRCIVKTQGTDCAACSEHCPTKAVDTQPYGSNLRLPVLKPESCIGCGACEFACPVEPEKAIRVAGLLEHRTIEPAASSPREPDPRPSGDFPF